MTIVVPTMMTLRRVGLHGRIRHSHCELHLWMSASTNSCAYSKNLVTRCRTTTSFNVPSYRVQMSRLGRYL